MPVISSTRGNPQLTDIVSENAFSIIGNSARSDANDVITNIDSELGKLFGDRNVTLLGNGSLTFSGTSLSLDTSGTLKLRFNQMTGGGSNTVPTVITVLTNPSTVSFTTDGDMWYAVVNRSGASATTAVASAATGLPTLNSSNLEIFVLAVRLDDALDSTKRLYFRSGFVMNSGDNTKLGAAIADTSTGVVINNNSSGSVTVTTGTSRFVPYLNIQSGHTYTVNSGAQLVSVDALTVNGTLTVSGEVKVL